MAVRVFAGSQPEGQEVAKVEAEVAGGQWSSTSLANEGESLQDGEYTAIAEQQSSLRNKAGVSAADLLHGRGAAAHGVRSQRLGKPYGRDRERDRRRQRGPPEPLPVRIWHHDRIRQGSPVRLRGRHCRHRQPRVRVRVPASTPECEFPLDRGVPMFARVNRLSAGTTYFFRIVTENEHGNGNQAIGRRVLQDGEPGSRRRNAPATDENHPELDHHGPERRRARRHDRQGARSKREERLDLEAPEERRLPAGVQAPGRRNRDDRLVLPAARARA